MQDTYRTLLRVRRLDFVVKTELNTRSPLSIPLLYAKLMGNRKPLTAKKSLVCNKLTLLRSATLAQQRQHILECQRNKKSHE